MRRRRCRRRQHHRRYAPPRHLTPLTRRASRLSQDDAKEAHTTTEILTEVAVEEILSLKKAEDERKKQLETERQQKKKFDEFGDDV